MNEQNVTGVKDEVAVASEQTTAVAQTQTTDRRGLEGVDTSTLKIPTAKLLQALSPEVAEDEFRDYGFRAGDIVHSLLLEKLPESFIALSLWDSNTMFVPDSPEGKNYLASRITEKFGVSPTEEELAGAFLCRSDDGRVGDRFGSCKNCQLCKFKGNNKPVCDSTVNILALFEGHEFPVIIRFSKTSLKHGNTFKNLAFMSNCALFAKKYKLMPQKKTDGNNTWYEMLVRPAGKATPEEYSKAEAFYSEFKDVAMTVHEDPNKAPHEDDLPF